MSECANGRLRYRLFTFYLYNMKLKWLLAQFVQNLLINFRGCSNCGCNGNRIRRSQVRFYWEGCGDEFGFAFNYTRRLLNHRATRMNSRVLMNRHNYEVGRRVRVCCLFKLSIFI